MSSNRRTEQGSDESTSTKYSIRSFRTAATSPPRGPDPEDHGWYATLQTHPIKSSDTIVKAWVDDGLCEAAMSEIRSLENWVSVDVLRRGLSLQPSDCPPTIVINIKPGSMEEHCIDVANRVKGHVERHDLDAAVEIVESSLCRQVTVNRVTKAPGIGASIALKDNPVGSGTLGGYVRLVFPKMGPKTYAMTCHHVLRTSHSTPADVDERDYKPQASQSPQRLVLSPSAEDMEEIRRARLEYLDCQQENLRQMEKEKENGCMSAARERGLNTLIEKVRITTERVHELEGYEMELGHVLASSGFRVAGSGCAIDWGLIEVDEKRVGANILREGLEDMPDAIQHVINISEFEEGKTAIKFGRSTDMTRGRFSFIKSHCLLPDSPHETTEHVFCSARSSAFSRFSEPGDSGAWVFSPGGGLGGIIVGGHTQNPWSYVTPMTEIFEDIEEQLECKVVLPDVYD